MNAGCICEAEEFWRVTMDKKAEAEQEGETVEKKLRERKKNGGEAKTQVFLTRRVRSASVCLCVCVALRV